MVAALVLALTFPIWAGAQSDTLIPIGHTVGIELSTAGVIVTRLSEVPTAQGAQMPARQAGVEQGDLIVQADGEDVTSNEALQKKVALSGGNPIALTVERKGERLTLKVTPVLDSRDVYRIGVLARDHMAGIGTLTYVDPETGQYGSLGHGVCDSETGVLVPLQQGRLMPSRVRTVQPGKSGEPGALQGSFSPENTVGTVEENTDSGIYGILTDAALYEGMTEIPVAQTNEVKLGDAVGQYDVQIVQLYPQDDEYGRGMMLRVTDEALLAQTGGIVQGMSGSPIVQDGKLIGAVTHVLVTDPTCGYGIHITRMLEEMEN